MILFIPRGLKRTLLACWLVYSLAGTAVCQESKTFLSSIPGYQPGYVEFESTINQSQPIVFDSLRLELDNVQVDRTPQLVCQTFKMLDRVGVRITNIGWGDTPEWEFHPFAEIEGIYRGDEVLPRKDALWKLTNRSDQFFFHRTGRLGMSFLGIDYLVSKSTRRPKVSRRSFGAVEEIAETSEYRVAVPRSLGSGPAPATYQFEIKDRSMEGAVEASNYLALQPIACTRDALQMDLLHAFGTPLEDTPTFFSLWYLKLPEATWMLAPESRTREITRRKVYGVSFEVAPEKASQAFAEKEINLRLNQGDKFQFPIYFNADRSLMAEASVWASYSVAGTNRRAEVKIVDRQGFRIQAPNTALLLKPTGDFLRSMIQQEPALVTDAGKLASADDPVPDHDLLDAYSLLRAAGSDADADRILDRLSQRSIGELATFENGNLLLLFAADRPQALLQKFSDALKARRDNTASEETNSNTPNYYLEQTIPFLIASNLDRDTFVQELQPHIVDIRKNFEGFDTSPWCDLAAYLGDAQAIDKLASRMAEDAMTTRRAVWIANKTNSPTLQQAISRLLQSDNPQPLVIESLLGSLGPGKDDLVAQFISLHAKEDTTGRYAAAFFEAIEYFERHGTNRSEGIELLSEYQHSNEVRDKAKRLLELK